MCNLVGSAITKAYLFPIIQLENIDADVLELVFVCIEQLEPGRVVGQTELELASRKVDAGACDRLGWVAHEDVGAETVVHVVTIMERNKNQP